MPSDVFEQGSVVYNVNTLGCEWNPFDQIVRDNIGPACGQIEVSPIGVKSFSAPKIQICLHVAAAQDFN
jgi:hypothetical protein